jgi:hypothetical protein
MLGRLPLVAEPGQSDSGRRIARSVGPAPATGAITSSGPKTSRLNRMSAPTQSARRQAIEEQKAEQPSRLSRLLPALKIAAGVLVVVGVGAVAFQFRGDSSSGSADTTAASAGSAAPLVAPVQSTRTDYAKKALPTQVKTLIANSQKLLAAPQPEAAAEKSFGAESSLNDSAKSSGADAPRAPSPAASPGVQGQLLRSPKALQACLAAIGAAGVQPVAVDLAKYAGREAAIIVLPADGGGYDVWVVSRDCRPDNDGTIDVVNVKP